MLEETIRTKDLGNQRDLLVELKRRGIRTTQPSLSRDLRELGVVKRDGVYKPSSLPEHERPFGPLARRAVHVRGLYAAGTNLIVIKTYAAEAPIAAMTIDKERLASLIGTLAGDDTVFVAVKGRADQRLTMEKISALLGYTGPVGASKGRAASPRPH